MCGNRDPASVVTAVLKRLIDALRLLRAALADTVWANACIPSATAWK